METLIRAIELFALVTGVAYVVLEILQKNAMWVLGIATGAACAFSFAVQRLPASMALNLYYVVMSVWGLHQWRKAARSLSDADAPASAIHLDRPSRPVLAWSLALTLGGVALLFPLLRSLGDAQPLLDAVVTVLSAVGTWWLAKSYPQQWLIWIVADLLSTLLCIRSSMLWMAVLYLVYAASAVYGYRHWLARGRYV